jgi:uncharacterized protein DUF6438
MRVDVGSLVVATLCVSSACVDAHTPAQIEHIAITRTACLGDCPVYNFTLDRSGAATFNGTSWTTMVGQYRGSIDSVRFAALARELIEGGFYTLDTVYEEAITDFPTVLICVQAAGAERCVRQYGRVRPLKFLQLAATIDSAVPKITWKPAGP